MTNQSSKDKGGCFELVGPKLTLILPGEYKCLYMGYETKFLFGRNPKLYVFFSVATGENVHSIYKYYNIVEIVGSPGPNGFFKVGPRSYFFRDWVRLFGDLEGVSNPMDAFEETGYFLCAVETVLKGADGFQLPFLAQYSKISRIISKAS